MSSTSNKRDTERVSILGYLQGEIMVFEPLHVTEISRGGVAVETSVPLALDSLHEVRLTLTDRSIVVKGRVVHSRICGVDQDVVTYSSGIEFIEPSDHVQAVISEFLDTLKAKRSGV